MVVRVRRIIGQVRGYDFRMYVINIAVRQIVVVDSIILLICILVGLVWLVGFWMVLDACLSIFLSWDTKIVVLNAGRKAEGLVPCVVGRDVKLGL